MSQDHLFEEEQFVISQELLLILHWLIKYQEAELSKIITQAYIQGFDDKVINSDAYHQLENSQDLQNSVVHFLTFLEHHIAHITHQKQHQTIMNPQVIQTLDRIDPKRFDYETIKLTVLATADKISSKNQHNAKNMFLKELRNTKDYLREFAFD